MHKLPQVRMGVVQLWAYNASNMYFEVFLNIYHYIEMRHKSRVL